MYKDCGTPPIIGGAFIYLRLTSFWVYKYYILGFKEENNVSFENFFVCVEIEIILSWNYS